ncbi:helix-turn-helix domain-containing protein [Telmatospirillum sp.]|uniref:ArsR/SmtB family transcription factor n=1 Tax=Telmatospirillum sp. TaxID=2079197 RepID=UPI00283F65D8|nr:helix-turn-helix domain-containing protein [Telmatospirillum sp.]MDR3435037.1 helix-turn-helix domain-containing protein [Telmatospirillum sp.]
MRAVTHPPSDQLDLSLILDALSDPIRRRIVIRLAACDEAVCSSFAEFAPKTNLSYHFTRLREAGLIRVRPEGTQRFISLRLSDLEIRFPGLLGSIIKAAGQE